MPRSLSGAITIRTRTSPARAPVSILPIGDARYIWQPPADVVERARATAFMREHGIPDWRALIARSQDDIEWFWDAVVEHLGIEFFQPYEQVLDVIAGAGVDALVRGRHREPDPQLRRPPRRHRRRRRGPP